MKVAVGIDKIDSDEVYVDGVDSDEVYVDDGRLDEQDIIVLCPFCFVFRDNAMIFADYVSNPMLWCNCGARAVFDLPIDVTRLSIEENKKVGNIKNLEKEYKNVSPLDKYDLGQKDIKFFLLIFFL